MTGHQVPSPPRPDELTSIVFRALYFRFDLLTIGATYVVIPREHRCSPGPAWARSHGRSAPASTRTRTHPHRRPPD